MTKRPQDVAGAHFFAPANVMKLCEVVRGHEDLDRDDRRRDEDGPRHRQDQRLVAGNCDGFVANRSRAPFITEMMLMLEEGALPEQVDKVMVDFGYPMGPFAVERSRRASTSATTRASAAPRPIRTTASCRSPTAWSRWAA